MYKIIFLNLRFNPNISKWYKFRNISKCNRVSLQQSLSLEDEKLIKLICSAKNDKGNLKLSNIKGDNIILLKKTVLYFYIISGLSHEVYFFKDSQSQLVKKVKMILTGKVPIGHSG